MCLSVFLAQLIGCFLVIVSVAMLVDEQRFKKTMSEFLGSNPFITFSGSLSVLLGLIVVLNHNIWISQWPVVITIIGWLVLLQGILRIFAPDTFTKMMKDMMSKSGFTIWSWVWLLVGVYLLWAGFYKN